MKKYLLFTILLVCPLLTQATEFIQLSEFDVVQSEIKYSLMNNQITDQKFRDSESDEITYSDGYSAKKTTSYKSPGKAFAMSLILPGWGQHYNGSSKLKSLAFLGAEITSWVLYFKWEKDADDLTDAYETFNNKHWIESRYNDMLDWTYSERDIINYTELSHHLPTTKTQQYYEMTGKYDQFAWGWDDATLDGHLYTDDFYSLNNPFPRVMGDSVPCSANRLLYETMRDDANNKYDQARKMVLVSMLNRMVSAFEAMITAKKNNSNNSGSSILSSFSAETSFKSIYVKRDTPYITLSMKF